MGLRPNRCYRDLERAFTRHATRVQRKDYVGGVPGVRVRKFVLGNQTKNFSHVVDLKATEARQVRDNAMEAVRQKIVRELDKLVGKGNWTLKLRLFPHHILRENKLASGAGADRTSTGMKHAFGKNIGRAAQVKKNDIFLSIVVDEVNVPKVKEILKRALHKLNLPSQIVVSKHENMRLSGRKKWTREAKLAKAQAAAAAQKEKK